MANVVFTPHLKRQIECPDGVAVGGTVREVLDAVFAGNPPLRGYIVDEHGELRPHVVVFVDGKAVQDRRRLGDRVAADSEIYVMQALSGG